MEPLPLADLLNFLFETVQHPDGRPYTELEVSKAVGVSFSTINHIRTGRSQKPAITTIKSIGQFFGVPLNYFAATSYEECRAIIAQARQVEAQIDDALSQIMLRSIGLSPEAKAQILEVIHWVEAAERERKRQASPRKPEDEG